MRDREEISNAIVKVVVAILLGVGLAALCSSCAALKNLFKPRVIHEVYTQIVTKEVHDTATFEIPVIVEKNVTKDTTSHLENPYGKSDAVVSGGLLWHTLETKPQTIRVPVVVHVTDTLVKEAEIKEIVTEVEKPLSVWRKFEIGAFPWLVGLALALLAWTFRKTIAKLIKR